MLIVITIVQSDAHDLVALSIKSSEELIPYRQEKRVILVQMLFVHRVVHMVIVWRDNKPASIACAEITAAKTGYARGMPRTAKGIALKKVARGTTKMLSRRAVTTLISVAEG